MGHEVGKPCEGCGSAAAVPDDDGELVPLTRWVPCSSCTGHWLCRDCDREVSRMRLGDPGAPRCDFVDRLKMALELAGDARSCFVCGGPGRAPEWACEPCRGVHRICQACVVAFPGVTSGYCATEARAQRSAGIR